MSEDHKKQLEQQLWNIANTLRGKMNADEFRDYILGFIFYKYLSERMHLYADKLLQQDEMTFEQVDETTAEGQEILAAIKEEAIEQLGYFLKPSELFHAIAKRGNGNGTNAFILDDLSHILNNIEQSTMGTASEDDFDKLFEDLDLTSTKLGRTESAKNELIAKVLAHLDKIDFQLENTNLDVLGDAYEYLIGKFASGAGKKAGEFYTPQEVSKILAKLVTTGKSQLKSVYDPTCGSGSLLLRVAKEVDRVSSFYGQELNRTTYNLARMNMILHGVHYRRFDIRQEDTLERPQHLDLRFEAIVANPPFSADWSANPLHLSDDRFSQYGKLAPKSKADFAFIQHMIYQLDENGQMAIVLPHGALFRGGAEGHIRQYLIEDRNYLDAVIGLPPNIFYGTSIPACILVFKKCREHPENILFIDASGEDYYEKGTNQNRLREEDIDRIIDTYRDRQTKEKYSYVATLEEVQENDYNLNIPRYVDTFEEEAPVDLTAVADALVKLEGDMKVNDATIAEFCNELGIDTPFQTRLLMMTKIEKKVPKLRFPGFEGEWEEKELEEFLSFKNGINASKEQYGKGVKFINVLDILNNDFITYDKIIGLVDIDEEAFLKNEVSYGDILFQRSSETREEVGLTNVYLDKEKKAVFGGFVIRGKKIKAYNPVFMNFLLKTAMARKEITSKSGGSTRYNISQDVLRSVKVVLPTLPEQKKIADFLTAVDTRIQQLTQKVDLLEQYKKGVMQQIFSRQIRFKDEQGRDFPEWEEKRLGEVSNKIMYGMNSSATQFDGKNKYLRITDIDEKSRLFSPNPLTSPEAKVEDKYKLKTGDIVFARTGASTGKCYLYKEEDGDLFFAGFLIKFSITKANPKFIFFQTFRSYYSKWVQVMSTRSGQPGINAEEFKSLKLFLPSLPEQQKIADFLTAIDKKIAQSTTQLEKMRNYKKALLQQMFI